MTEQRRIPRGIDPFDPYINRIVAYLLEGNPTTNAERVGIGTDEVQFLSNMLTEWKPLYLKYTDKKNTRTTTVIDQAYRQCPDRRDTAHFALGRGNDTQHIHQKIV